MSEAVVTLHTPVYKSEAQALAFEISDVLGSKPEDVARLLSQERRPLSLVMPEKQAGRVLKVLRRAGLEAELGRKKSSVSAGFSLYPKLGLALLAILLLSAVGPLVAQVDLSSLFKGADNATSAPPVQEDPQVLTETPVETLVSPPPDTVGVAEEASGGGAGALEKLRTVENSVEASAGVEVNGAVRETPSLFALATGAAPALREALADTDPDPTDAYGQTPLMYAARAGNVDAVQAFLDAGAFADARSGAGWTALMYAARDNPDARIAEAIFEAGGDPSLRNDEGKTPLDLALSSGNQAFVYWLNERLFRAAEAAPADTLRTLLEAGAVVDGRDAYGQTPLMYAVHKNRQEAVSALLAAGADPNARSRAGWTPLMYAARDADANVAAALLTAGAKPGARNGEGKTARDLALAYNNTAVAERIGRVEAAARASRLAAPPPALPPAPTVRPTLTQPDAAARAAEKAALFRCLQERVGCEDLDLP